MRCFWTKANNIHQRGASESKPPSHKGINLWAMGRREKQKEGRKGSSPTLRTDTNSGHLYPPDKTRVGFYCPNLQMRKLRLGVKFLAPRSPREKMVPMDCKQAC